MWQKTLPVKDRLRLLLFGFLLTSANVMSAIPLELGGEEPPCGEPFGAPCPLDGGLLILAAAAAVYGGKKVYSRQSK